MFVSEIELMNADEDSLQIQKNRSWMVYCIYLYYII